MSMQQFSKLKKLKKTTFWCAMRAQELEKYLTYKEKYIKKLIQT